MKLIRNISLMLLVVLPGFNAYTQSIEFSAKASKQTVAADEAFRLTYSTNVQADFTPPDLKDFKLLSGPSSSSQTSVSIINGQMKQSVSMIWTLIVRPKKEGEFTVPPASITYNNKIYKSNGIKISVTAATGNGQSVPGTNDHKPNVNSGGKNAFCTISVSKSTLYKGEPAQVTYKLYTRNQAIVDYELKLGTQKDVWSQELNPKKGQITAYKEVVNGVPYAVYDLKKEIIFPQKSGKLKLEPFDMMVVVRAGFFDTQRYDMVSNSPTLEVMPLPPNAPASFNNAVGKFSFEASINKEVVDVNDGIDITVKLTGTGNIKLIEPQKLNFPQDFEVYDPELTDKTSVNATGMTGSKTYKYLVIPRHSGDFTIEPIQFTYFDLDTKNYVTLSSPEFKIKVNKTKDETANNGSGIVSNKQDVQILEKDIRYLKPMDAVVAGRSSFFTGSALYYAGLVFPPALFLLLVFMRKRKDENYDEATAKQKQANKQAVKQLTKAGQYLSQNNKEEFYAELTRGIQNYYCDKFNVQMIDFNKGRIPEIMGHKGVGTATVQQFLALIEHVEMARYASFMQGNEQKMFADVNHIIQQIETEVKA